MKKPRRTGAFDRAGDRDRTGAVQLGKLWSVCPGPRRRNGLGCLAGIGLVDFVLELVADGYSADEIAREYPEFEVEDVRQAARYSSSQ